MRFWFFLSGWLPRDAPVAARGGWPGLVAVCLGADVFVHYSAIESNGFRSLEEDQRVQFDVTQGPKGPQAERVRVV